MIDLGNPFQLLYYASKGNKDGVLGELEKGVSPNLADYEKRTALHLASCEGHMEVVELLLEKEANVNSVDRRGRTGAYGEIYLVKWRGTNVAAKTIRPSIASNIRVKNIFLKELALWQRLLHPNIVQFLGVLNCDRLIFLTEYLCNVGSLYDILKKKGRLDPVTVVAYALDIARGVNYLHQNKPHPVIHRDLTPRNILQDEAGRLKIIDFGLSKITLEKESYGAYKMTGGTGSYRYMAPEVYRRESYGKHVDVFSFALVVYEMFHGGPTNRRESPESVADRRAYEDARPSLSSSVYPNAMKKLLQECWHKDPESRPSFEEIITQLELIQEKQQDKENESCCFPF
ncbi:hypothetical protein MRB53_032416 [Persea americana]|uniref:Uncharacterized protein n=1 Tax=Persea americana TaxID=3435 RepID=A0ACC2KSQ3_PERAE|nr:hypothetical protein MRB53_032416 [Persea americana]